MVVLGNGEAIRIKWKGKDSTFPPLFTLLFISLGIVLILSLSFTLLLFLAVNRQLIVDQFMIFGALI